MISSVSNYSMIAVGIMFRYILDYLESLVSKYLMIADEDFSCSLTLYQHKATLLSNRILVIYIS